VKKTLLVAAVVGLATVGGHNAAAQGFNFGGFTPNILQFGPGFGGGAPFNPPVTPTPQFVIPPFFQNPVSGAPQQTPGFSSFLIPRVNNAALGAFGVSGITRLFGIF